MAFTGIVSVVYGTPDATGAAYARATPHRIGHAAFFWYFKNPLGGMMEYFCDPDYVTGKWQPHNYKVNRFSEWHLADGIKVPNVHHGGPVRPSLAMAKAIDKAAVA